MADKNVQLHNADGDNLLPKTTLQNITDLTIETITPTITRSSGNSTIAVDSVKKYGKIVQMQVTMTKTGTINAGDNAFNGTLNGYRPVTQINAAAFNGSSLQVLTIDTSGVVTIRQLIGSYQYTASTFGFTYITAS